MALDLTDLRSLATRRFDTVIDVRSPAEFAEDHLPGAINLPVLNDAERARVGTIYKQRSPFEARKIGGALVFRNAADHVRDRLRAHDGSWQPLVYCWRGGQRSGAFSWMLREIGWRAETVSGGYRSFRRLVVRALYDTPLPLRLIQLGGHTGTAKTALLSRLAARGVQVLDLEALARHRGSLLGDLPGGQPAQKGFETALAMTLLRFDADRPLLVEAESSKIGRLLLPPSLWTAMKAAPWIVVTAPVEARARYLAAAYGDVLADKPRLKARLSPLRAHRGEAVLGRWGALIDGGDDVALCAALARDHYDPAYRTAMRAVSPHVLARIEAGDLGGDALDAAADRIAETLQTSAIRPG